MRPDPGNGGENRKGHEYVTGKWLAMQTKLDLWNAMQNDPKDVIRFTPSAVARDRIGGALNGKGSKRIIV